MVEYPTWDTGAEEAAGLMDPKVNEGPGEVKPRDWAKRLRRDGE